MESVFRLGVIFRVVDRFSAPVRRMGALLDANRDKLRAMGQDFRRWGRTALIAGGIAAAAAIAPANAYGKFEAELAAVRTMTQATDAQFQQLERTAIQLGIETEHSPQAAIEAFRALSAQGLTLDQQFKAIRPSLLLSTAGQIGLAQAAETTASALNAFGIEAGQTKRVVDVLMKATTISALRAGEYQMALGKIGPAAQASNQQFEDMIALMGAMRSQGVTAESAAEKIRVSLQVLRAPTAEAAKLLRGMGIETRDAGGKMLPFARIVDNLQRALAGMDDATRDQIVSTIFGRDAMQAYESATQAAFTDRSGAIHRGTDALRTMSGELRNSQGAAQEFADAFLNTFEGRVKLLTGSMSTANLVFGKFLAEALRPLVEWGTRALNWLIAWVQQNPVAAKWIARLLVLGAGMALIFGGLALVLGAVFAAIAVLGGPITLIIAGVAAMSAAVAGVVIWWDELVDAIKRAGRAFLELPFVRGIRLAGQAAAGALGLGAPAPSPPQIAAESARRRGNYQGVLEGMRGGTSNTVHLGGVVVNDRADADYLIDRIADVFGGLVTAEQE